MQSNHVQNGSAIFVTIAHTTHNEVNEQQQQRDSTKKIPNVNVQRRSINVMSMHLLLLPKKQQML